MHSSFFSVWLINAQYITTLCDFIFQVHDKSNYDMDLTTTSGTSNLMYVHCLMIIPSENQDAQLFFLCHLFSCHFLVSARGHIVMVPPDLQVQHLPAVSLSCLWVWVWLETNQSLLVSVVLRNPQACTLHHPQSPARLVIYSPAIQKLQNKDVWISTFQKK